MNQVEKIETLMSTTYHVEYKPSACIINPYFKLVQHRTRPCLATVLLRDKYPRRSLSAVLNEKAVNPLTNKAQSSLNTLHQFETNL